MSKHTPAPWYIDGTVRGTDLIVSNDDYQVAICITHPNPESNKANARLIAAAPELLEALQAAVTCGMVPSSTAADGGANKHSEWVRVADQIRAAIAKATGE